MYHTCVNVHFLANENVPALTSFFFFKLLLIQNRSTKPNQCAAMNQRQEKKLEKNKK